MQKLTKRLVKKLKLRLVKKLEERLVKKLDGWLVKRLDERLYKYKNCPIGYAKTEQAVCATHLAEKLASWKGEFEMSVCRLACLLD